MRSLQTWRFLALLLSLTIFMGGLVWVSGLGRMRAQEANCAGQMHWLGSLLNGYKERQGLFPPARVCGPDGKPLYSGLMLVYAGELSTADQRPRLDLSWDSASNARFISQGAKAALCLNHPAEHSVTASSYIYLGPPPQSEARAHETEAEPGPVRKRLLLFECAGWDHSWADPTPFALNDLTRINPGGDPQGPGVFFDDGTFQRLLPEELRALVRAELVERLTESGDGENFSG